MERKTLITVVLIFSVALVVNSIVLLGAAYSVRSLVDPMRDRIERVEDWSRMITFELKDLEKELKQDDSITYEIQP